VTPQLRAIFVKRCKKGPMDRRETATLVAGRGLAGRGALVVGIVTEVSATVLPPEDKSVSAFVILVAVLLLRPQDHIPGLTSFHVAEICAVLGIAPMLLHRFTHRLPVFRITPETLGLIVFGALSLIVGSR